MCYRESAGNKTNKQLKPLRESRSTILVEPRMGKFSIRTAAVFSVFVFLTVFVTVFLTMSMVFFMFHTGLLSISSRGFVLLIPMFTSTVVGTLLSITFGKKPVKLVENTNEALCQVAKGNFDVKMDENLPVSELREIARNFNAMTRELAGTEMLRNDFVENVSHEFKTPLTAIEGYATLLQQKNLPEEKRLEYTRKILHSTRRLGALTGNILLLSRLENQELEIKKERYSLDEQLRETILLLESAWSSKSIELDIELADCDYTANQELMGQVWQNILSNAIKFSPEKSLIQVRLHKEPDRVVISVSDNGPGMSQEVLGRVFEKFYQGDASRSAQGNGLGLPLAKRIIDLHRGSITVHCPENGGTVFTIVLPLCQTA